MSGGRAQSALPEQKRGELLHVGASAVAVFECFEPASRDGFNAVAGADDRSCHGRYTRVEREHLQYYLDEFTFRFNRRRSKARGMLFYRLLQQSVNTDPHPLADLIGAAEGQEQTLRATAKPLPGSTFDEFF